MNKEQADRIGKEIAQKVLAEDKRRKESPEPAPLVQSVGDAVGILEQLSEIGGWRLTKTEHEALKLVLICMNDRELM
jgi:hypothetical protein